MVGIISIFVMPPSVCEPARAFRRPDGTNKWWTTEEEKTLVNRILRDDPTKGDMNNRTAVTLKGLLQIVTNYDLWPIFIVGIFAWMPFQPTANYLSLILRDMGYSVFESNMLAIPGYALFAINVCHFMARPRCSVFNFLTLVRKIRFSSSVDFPNGPAKDHLSPLSATYGCSHSS